MFRNYVPDTPGAFGLPDLVHSFQYGKKRHIATNNFLMSLKVDGNEKLGGTGKRQ